MNVNRRRQTDKFGAQSITRIMTIDFMIATIIAAFGLGSIWISLKSDVAGAQVTTKSNSVALSVMVDDIESVKTTVAVIQVQAVESEKRNAERAAASEKRDDALQDELRDIKQILLQQVTQ